MPAFATRRPGCVHARRAGFTLIEMLVVIVVIGALSVVARVSIAPVKLVQQLEWRASLDSSLRQARSIAYARRRLVCASIQPAGLTVTMAPSDAATSCSLGVARLDVANAQSVATTLPTGFGTLFFRTDGRIALDAAGVTAASGSITFADAAPIVVDGTLGVLR